MGAVECENGHGRSRLFGRQEGTALIRSCGKLLDEAELQVKKIMTDANGEPLEEDFSDEP